MKHLFKLLIITTSLIISVSVAKAQLSGTYTIGNSGDYQDISTAVMDIEEVGISGDVVFNITQGTYSETIYIYLQNPDHSVVFQAAPSNTEPVIWQSASHTVINIDAGENILFDGIHFRNLTTDESQQACVIQFSPLSDIPTKSIAFTNCIFTGFDTSGFQQGQTFLDKEIVRQEKTGGTLHNILFQFCTFNGGTTAISLHSDVVQSDSLALIDNQFINNLDTAVSISNYTNVNIQNNSFPIENPNIDGIIALNLVFNTAIKNNEIIGIINSYESVGQIISVYEGHNLEISGNHIEIEDIAEYSFSPIIDISYTSGNQLITGNYLKINAQGRSAVGFMEVYDNVDIINNMIIVNGSANQGLLNLYVSGNSFRVINNSFSIAEGKVISIDDSGMGTTPVLLFNNILANNSEEPIIFSFSESFNLDADNNIYHSGGGILFENFIAKTQYISLEDWQLGTGNDMNSYLTNPQFINSASDLHLQLFNPAEGRAMTYTDVLTDFDGEPRDPNTPDIGADEGDFILSEIEANAGPDQAKCGNVFTMAATMPATGNTGIWSVTQGSAEIQDVSDPSTQVIKVQPGNNILRWTVTNGEQTVYDEVRLINFHPMADAGDDVSVFLDDYTAFPDVQLHAVSSQNPDIIGSWEVFSSPGSPIIDNSYAADITVSNITAGEHILRWTVVDYTNGECSNFDDVAIIAGYSYVSQPPAGEPLDWSNPAHWNLGNVPGPSDSVTVFDCIANVDGISASCYQLVVGSGSEMNISGNAKAAGNFTTRGLYIEQTAVKFPGVKGDAVVNVTGEAELNVGAEYFKNNRSSDDFGVVVGSGGELNVNNSGLRDKTAKNTANLNIGRGGLYIEQTAVRSNASVSIGSGGSLYIEQTAVKESGKEITNPGIHIGAGGGLYIEQTAVKDRAAGQVVLGAGRGIYIEQTAVKSQGGLVVRGGSLYIEQTAVKSKSAQNGINIGAGGSLYIEQTAVKSTATVSAPFINVTDGQIVVGSDNKSKAAGGNLSFRGLYIEQTAVKGLASDTALIVNSGASIYLDTTYTEGSSYFEMSPGSVVSLMEGSSFFADNGTEDLSLIVSSTASLIDKSDGLPASGFYRYDFPALLTDAVGFPFETFNTGGLSGNPAVLTWDEYAADWISAASQQFGSMQAFAANYGNSAPGEQAYAGTFNKGYQSVGVFNSGVDALSGWNLASNPYPSAINLDAVEFGSYINPFVYVYDSEHKTFSLYSENGINLNGASNYIPSGEAFVINALADTDLFLDTDAQEHYLGEAVPNKETPVQTLKVRVSGDQVQDELAVHFNDNASNDLDYGLDALKFPNFEEEALNFFSKIGISNDESYAVNAMPLTTSNQAIPIFFASAVSGEYTLDLTENTLLDDNVDVYLQDIFNPTLNQNLREEPVYTFNHQYTNTPYRFNLIVGQMVTDTEEERPENVLVYAAGETVFLNSTVHGSFAVEMYDISGRMLVKKEFYGAGMHQFHADVASGVYILKVTDDIHIGQSKVFIGK